MKGYCYKGLWTAEMVINDVGRWITADEAEEILDES